MEVKEVREVKGVKEEIKQEEPKARPKGKMARELADIREGRVSDADNESAKVGKKEKIEEPEPAEELAKEDSVAAAKVEPMPASKPVPEATPAPKPVPEAKSTPKPAPAVTEPTDAPVFKLQILAASTKLKPTDPQLKGQKNVDFYQEGGLYKFTLGSSENYQEIVQLRKAQLTKFPQAFIIAFKNGKKMNVQEAIQEYKRSKR